MKLSFSVANGGESSPKPSRMKAVIFSDAAQDNRDAKQSSKQYVTEFDSSKTLAEIDRKKYVIPPMENEWKPYKKMKNLELPLDASGKHNSLDFELEEPVVESDEKMSYGLNLRENEGKVPDGDAGDENRDRGGGDERVRDISVDNMLLEKLKYDLDRLPEDRGFEEFDEVPVEGFGASLLAGYGWVEGGGIGKNAKHDVKVKEYTRRTAKEGLGFYDDKYADARKEVREERVIKKERANQDVVMKEEEKFGVGDEVRVVAGGGKIGLKGSVVKILARDRLLMKHSITGEELEVQLSDVALLGSKEEEECLKKLKELKLRASKEEVWRVEEHRGKEKKEDKETDYITKEVEKPHKQIDWLTSNIKVRVISKDVKGGRLYCKTGKVVDVVGPMTCYLYMDDNRELVQGVDQELLEAVVPGLGGPVLVLYGEHKGVYGTLMERYRENGTGIVRDAASLSLLHLGLEQIAEYVGDPAELGY